MTSTRSVALLALIAVVGLLAAPAVSGAVVGAFTDGSGESTTESESNASVGTFMQASAADTENSVEAGIFKSKYDATDDDRRAAVVLERTGDLEERFDDLEAERAELREQRDDLHPGEYRARMAQLTVAIQSLERSIDRTEHRANETGVDSDRLTKLRENASKLTGQEVAELARGLAGDGHSGQGNGPPTDPGNQTSDDHPGQGNAQAPGQDDGGSPGNESPPGQADETPPGQADDSPGNSQQHSSDDRGNETTPGSSAQGPNTDRENSDRQGNGQGDGPDSDRGNGTGQGAPSNDSAATLS